VAEELRLLEQGHFAGVATDVYGSTIASCRHPRLIKTPHIGAMTEEAQLRIAWDAVRILKEEAVSGVSHDAG
jgi:phosphoglycerate dehydrogenase-like enzyme